MKLLLFLTFFSLNTYACINFSGQWDGHCHQNNRKFPKMIKIKQDNCKSIEESGIQKNIGHAYNVSGNDGIQSRYAVYDYSWDKNRQRLNGKVHILKHFMKKPGSYYSEIKKSFFMEGDELIYHITIQNQSTYCRFTKVVP